MPLPCRLAAAVLALHAAGCISPGRFTCATSDQCGAMGLCEPSGCSFPDSTCNTGRRFGQFSEAPSECTGEDAGPTPDGGDGGNPGPDGGDGGPSCTMEVVAGGAHTCVLRGTKVSCFGNNDSGQVGDGTRLRRSLARPVGGALPPVAQLALGGFHSCARTVAGEVWCWGDDDYQQIADPRQGAVTTPQKIPGLGPVQDIAAGVTATCAVETDGDVMCWGQNNLGQLGTGSAGASGGPFKVVDIPAMDHVIFGGYFACGIARAPGGQVWCWGDNDVGQLAGNDIAVHARPVQSMVTGAVQLVASQDNACARKADGSLWCWGWNELGQLGTGSAAGYSAVPVQVSNVSDVIDMAGHGNGNYLCALEQDGDLWCWGNDNHGQHGSQSPTYSRGLPRRANLGGKVTTITAGAHHACGVVAGILSCWGDDALGQLGDGALVASAVPVEAPMGGWSQLSAGDDHTCGLQTAGGGYCWGLNGFGQVGDGTSQHRALPVAVTLLGGAGVAQLAPGGWRTCARTTAGGAQCWGHNVDGALGNNEMPPMTHESPVLVSGLTGIDHIASGGSHTCARRASDGTILCWGKNSARQLGDGTTMQRLAPVASTVTGALDVVTGGDFSCARTATMGVTCWGEHGGGQLGDGTALPRTAPVIVIKTDDTPLGGVIELAAGLGHTCARTATKVYCWGYGYGGQLGNGSFGVNQKAAEVPGLTAMRIFAGGYRTCAINMAGALLCWGDNFQGSLGDGNWLPRAVPTPVTGLATGVREVAIGRASHACALMMDGRMRCWGSNESGQLGVGLIFDQLNARNIQDLSCE